MLALEAPLAASLISTQGLGKVRVPAPSEKWNAIMRSPAAMLAGSVTLSSRSLLAREDVAEPAIDGNAARASCTTDSGDIGKYIKDDKSKNTTQKDRIALVSRFRTGGLNIFSFTPHQS